MPISFYLKGREVFYSNPLSMSKMDDLLLNRVLFEQPMVRSCWVGSSRRRSKREVGR
jgi:hypothetical protein